MAEALNLKSSVLCLIHIWLTEVRKTITTQHQFICDELRAVRRRRQLLVIRIKDDPYDGTDFLNGNHPCDAQTAEADVYKGSKQKKFERR